MEARGRWEPDPSRRYLSPLRRYKETVTRQFPALEGKVLNNCALFPIDAIFLGYFLESYPRRVVAFEVGAFVGISGFCLASHPNVSKVISVDLNPVITEELAANSDVWTGRIDLEPLEGLRVFDVARAALEEYPEQREKVEHREGVVGSTRLGAKLEPDEDVERVEVPTVDPSGEEELVALVDGLHTREGVGDDLAAIYDRNPDAIAFLDDCRHGWGPFVQAGVVDFMEQAGGEYRFRLVGDLAPALASSNFGMIYPTAREEEVGGVLRQVTHEFSSRLDPLRLLRRETELIADASRLNGELRQARRQLNQSSNKQSSKIKEEDSGLQKQNAQLTRQNENLKQRTSHLEAHYASKRYKLADALAETSLRVPGLKRLLRGSAPPDHGSRG